MLSIRVFSKIPLIHIIGAHASFFSIDQVATPVMGSYCSNTTFLGVYALRVLVNLCTVPTFGLLSLHLPTTAAGIYLKTNSRSIKVAIPLLCIVAFFLDSVGSSCMLYTLYWIPPIFLGLVNSQSIFARSLGATLTAHAVGSTLWLYTHTTTPTFWYSLIGIVWAERLFFALCITATCYAIAFFQQWVTHPPRLQLRRSTKC